MNFLSGFADELTKLAASEQDTKDKQLGRAAAVTGAAGVGAGVYAHKNPAKFKKFVNSESGAMFAEHLPFGGALLGALRGEKGHAGGGMAGRVRNAARGTVGSTIGNVAGATAGAAGGALISHVLKSHGKNVPGWLMPTAIGAGGLAIAPAVVHRFTHG